MNSRAVSLLAILVLAACGGSDAAEGGPVPLAVSLEPVAELSSERAILAPSLDVSVARFGAGTFAVSHRYRPAAILLYSDDGELVRTYDARGSGPGDLRTAPLLFRDRTGGLLAVDQDRVHVFDDSLGLTDTRRLELFPVRTAAFLPGGRIVVDQRVRIDVGDEVLTVHILTASGEVEDSLVPRSAPPRLPILAPASDGGFWVAEANVSVLQRFDLTGNLVDTVRVRREREWFSEWEGRVEGEGFSVRPRPQHWALWEFAENQLGLISWVADRGWSPVPYPGEETPWLIPAEIDNSAMWESILEVIDAHTGEVLAEGTSRKALSRVEGSHDLVFSTRLHGEGHVVVEVMRVHVRDTLP